MLSLAAAMSEDSPASRLRFSNGSSLEKRMIKKGLTLFKINGSEIWALNRENAKRKYLKSKA